jgi:hypothetical protein
MVNLLGLDLKIDPATFMRDTGRTQRWKVAENSDIRQDAF